MPQTIATSVPGRALRHGPEIPALGLGTWQLEGTACEETVLRALRMGYRHIDTAEAYGNEEQVGRALADADVEPQDVFVTSKVWHDHLRHDDVLEACGGSLERLGLDALDLYLIHWPNASVPLEETVAAMEELREKGTIRAWGVSNFTVAHLRETLEHGAPSVNQVELHPRLRQEELDRFCRESDIVLTAYSPLARGEAPGIDALEEIGERYGKSGAQVALRWSLQHGHVVIPKSSGRDHLAENADVLDFTLTDDEMATVDGLDRGERHVTPDFAEFDRS